MTGRQTPNRQRIQYNHVTRELAILTSPIGYLQNQRDSKRPPNLKQRENTKLTEAFTANSLVPTFLKKTLRLKLFSRGRASEGESNGDNSFALAPQRLRLWKSSGQWGRPVGPQAHPRLLSRHSRWLVSFLSLSLSISICGPIWGFGEVCNRCPNWEREKESNRM